MIIRQLLIFKILVNIIMLISIKIIKVQIDFFFIKYKFYIFS
jgi:hypothetical protein